MNTKMSITQVNVYGTHSWPKSQDCVYKSTALYKNYHNSELACVLDNSLSRIELFEFLLYYISLLDVRRLFCTQTSCRKLN